MSLIEDLTDSFNQIIESTQNNIDILGLILAVLFGVFILNIILGHALFILGITPRKSYGLLGIIFAPFLHANFNHLFFNLIPLLVLADFILIEGVDVFINVSVYIAFLSGLLTWCFGRSAIHIGASSVITGYWSYLVVNTYLQESVLGVILGVICVYYFAGIFFGIFPQQKGVSWEGHLFGLIAGIIVNLALQYFPILFIV